MRTIKFRAWDKRDNLWIAGFNIPQSRKYSETDNIALMQFTGLLDKNGKEIYEGDIVKIPFHDGINEYNIEIKWDNHRGNRIIGYWAGFNVLDCKSEDIEIIGNIYENPDLLTKQ